MMAQPPTSSEDYLQEQHNSTNIFSWSMALYCLISRPTSVIFVVFYTSGIFIILPLTVSVLHRGFREWFHKSSPAAAQRSHSECFTFHAVVMELLGVLACVFCFCGIYRKDMLVLSVGGTLIQFSWFGQTMFEVVTCCERYLAVFHPVFYLSTKNEKGVKMRNAIIGCVWLICLGRLSLEILVERSILVDLCFLFVALPTIVFCSLSVLIVLTRPGPADQRKRTDQSKQKAFYTILIILGMLLFKAFWSLAQSLVFVIQGSFSCEIMACEFWANLPSCLVLPLLYLHRTGQRAGAKTNPGK